MKINPLMLFLSALLFLVAACNDNAEKISKNTSQGKMNTDSILSVKKPMPAFSLHSAFDDTMISSDIFSDKILLITFFASWCPSCFEEMVQLKDLQRDLSDQGFSVVGLAVDKENRQAVKRFVEKAEINYPVLFADDTIADQFGGVTIIPTSFLVDYEGYIIKKYLNHADDDAFRKGISDLLVMSREKKLPSQ